MSVRRLILIFMGTIGIVAFFGSFVFHEKLEEFSPSVPVPAAQQVYPLSDHSYDFYVTREQYWLFQTLVHGGWGVAALTAVLNYRWKVIHNWTLEGWKLPK